MAALSILQCLDYFLSKGCSIVRKGDGFYHMTLTIQISNRTFTEHFTWDTTERHHKSLDLCYKDAVNKALKDVKSQLDNIIKEEVVNTILSSMN